MIHTDTIAFIHFMKTGGMSMTRHLINIADDPVTLFADPPSHKNSYAMAVTPDRRDKLTCIDGKRHATPQEAIAMMRAAGLRVPDRAFVMIRHPVDLMLSYYKHMRKPKVWAYRGMTRDTLRGHPKLAMERPFREFCHLAPFYGLDDAAAAAFFEPAGFKQLDVVPLERIGAYLTLRFGQNRNFAGVELGHQNRSEGGQNPDGLGPQLRAKICDSYPKLLAAYEAACTTDWQG